MVETDLELHRRIIFIQNISPETTRQSLNNYFSEYPIERSAVPHDATGKIAMSLNTVYHEGKTSYLFCVGKNKMHGIVTFRSEKSVDAVMSKRFHRIDGKEVFIHRSVPTQRSAKDNYGIQQLIVSSQNNQSLVESDIKSYFSDYGDIINMKNDGNTWIIDFD